MNLASFPRITISQSAKQLLSTLSLLLPALLAALLFIGTLNYEFTYDDYYQIEVNSYVQQESQDLAGIFKIFTVPTFPGDLYRPLVALSFKVDQLTNQWLSDYFPIRPAANFHLHNVLLHAANCLLITLILQLLGMKLALNLLISSIYAVHPIHIEAVANVYNRTELYAAFFVLLSLRLSFARQTLIKAALVGACFLFACWSKESALTAVPLICGFILVQARFQSDRHVLSLKNLWLLAPYVLSALLYLFLRKLVLAESYLIDAAGSSYVSVNPLLTLEIWQRILPACYLYGEYLRLIFFPASLSADYTLAAPYAENFFASFKYYSGIATFLVFLTGLALLRKQRVLVCGGLFFLVTFSLTINLVVPIGTIMADRLAYLPSLGAIVLLIVGMSALLRRVGCSTPFVLMLSVAYFCYLSWFSLQRIPVWQNNQTLMHQMYLENPRSSKAANNLGLIYYKQRDYQACSAYFLEGILRDPSTVSIGSRLAVCLFKNEEYRRSAFWTQKTLATGYTDKNLQDLARRFRDAGLMHTEQKQ